ncbi:uncharacterized protein LOC127286375 [Leptopilina boulardi]|uniref:uncharacterized protein LOC127286375 n=1 Tax=Leptopilina boulardi TaxID=63433 RepID=UPI0021F53AD6|nr:uncharacterized protein LOC127286375 [Leptopilina boulardi]
MLRPGLKTGSYTPIIAQQTTLGWIFNGSTKTIPSNEAAIPSHSVISLPCIIQNNLPQLLQRFWEQEEVSPSCSFFLTEEEQDCEKIFTDTHSRTETGRYMVRLPFKGNPESLGDSRTQALRTLKGMERKFERNPLLYDAYNKFFVQYSDLKHMEPAPALLETDCYYLPLHGVFKESSTTTKLRVVYNGSQRSSTGVSLNELLHTGQKLQIDMSEILLRWHIPHTFKLSTVTYGLASSPYLAIRVLKQLAKDKAVRFPKATPRLLEQIYVDDLFDGSDYIDSALELQKEYIDLLMAGGLPLRKWTSNNLSLLDHLPTDWVESSQTLSWKSEEEYILIGLHWKPVSDTFVFRSTLPDLPEASCKRSVLSSISKLYDPLGWIAPFTIVYKVFMRTLWEEGIDWDTTLPSQLLKK